MMLADVDAGSDTPSLVGKVLKWRKEDATTGVLADFHLLMRLIVYQLTLYGRLLTS